jgi:hypothetical protein
LTKISSGDKLNPVDDNTLDRLLDLDGEVMELGGGFWVKIKARRVKPSAARTHGVNYSLCLFGPKDERLICYDNAHPIRIGSGPAKKRTSVRDHAHEREAIRPYVYTSAEGLLVDFWTDVYRILKEEGVP